MFVATWSFDMHYGMRQEAMKAIKEIGATVDKVPGWKAKGTRVLWGSIGAPESRIVLEPVAEPGGRVALDVGP